MRHFSSAIRCARKSLDMEKPLNKVANKPKPNYLLAALPAENLKILYIIPSNLRPLTYPRTVSFTLSPSSTAPIRTCLHPILHKFSNAKAKFSVIAIIFLGVYFACVTHHYYIKQVCIHWTFMDTWKSYITEKN